LTIHFARCALASRLAAQLLPCNSPEHLAKLFKLMDRGGDGALTADEIRLQVRMQFFTSSLQLS
jgi:Ca2+-binding EF-hand superfamily protein